MTTLTVRSTSIGFREVKQTLRMLLERVRRTPSGRWPWSAWKAKNRLAWLPTDRTGWTVHRDVALRLRNLSIDAAGTTLASPGTEVGTFKIRLAGSPKARREAGKFVRERYTSRGYLTSAKRPVGSFVFGSR